MQQPETFLQKQLRLKAEREAVSIPRAPAPAAPVEAGNPRATRWVDVKLTESCRQVAGAPEGQRNDTLNHVAYSLGRLIPKWLDEATVADALLTAAHAAGLGGIEASNTIRSGLNSGQQDPRDPPISDDSSGGLASLVAGASMPTRQPETPGEPEIDEDAALRILVRQHLKPLDWHELWADDSEEEWILEPLLPARRLVALYSAPKVGKSLLMLELAVAISRGITALGVTPDRPRRVLYVDFENDPKADVRERLQAMGQAPADLDGLVYLSFPTLAALDSDRGGRELMAAVAEYTCEVVVVDTVSRSIAGEENENDTWLAFYRHTGLRLKQAGVALIRLDHSGKDETKGQRGGSAKSGDVDAVWRLSRVTDDTYRLDCEAARMPVVERVLVLHRKQGPLRHTVDAEGRLAAFKAKVDAVVKALDEAGAEPTMGGTNARKALRAAGLKAGNDVIAAAVKRRSQAVRGWSGQVPPDALSGDGPGQRRTAEEI